MAEKPKLAHLDERDLLDNDVAEETDWLKERHGRLLRELTELLAVVPDQGESDRMEEVIARVRVATDHFREAKPPL